MQNTDNKKFTPKDVLGLIILVVIIGMVGMGIYEGLNTKKTTTYTSTTTPSTVSKKCSWCSKEFTGYGYYHIVHTCNLQTETSIEGNLCSLKCCNESSQAH